MIATDSKLRQDLVQRRAAPVLAPTGLVATAAREVAGGLNRRSWLLFETSRREQSAGH